MFSKHCTKKIVISLTMKTSCFTMDFGLEKLIFEYSFNKSFFLVRISVQKIGTYTKVHSKGISDSAQTKIFQFHLQYTSSTI